MLLSSRVSKIPPKTFIETCIREPGREISSIIGGGVMEGLSMNLPIPAQDVLPSDAPIGSEQGCCFPHAPNLAGFMSLTGLWSISWRPKGEKESSTTERCDFGTDPCAATVSQCRYGDRQGYWLIGGKHPGRVGLPESMEAMVADLVAHEEGHLGATATQ
jgi:hypothetical protein